MRIATVCGSLGAGSKNAALLERAAELAPPEITVRASERLDALPHFNPDLADAAPAPVARWRELLDGSAGVLIASPEYGHSLPGVVKNALDWLVGSGELHQKRVAITAAVRHPARGRRGLGALRDTLQAIDVQVVWDEPIVCPGELDARLTELWQRLVLSSGS